MIKNIVFDLGNVLIAFQPEKFVNKNVPEEYKKDFYKIVFQNDEWKKLDRGTLEYDEAVKIFSEKIPQCREAVRKLFDENIISCLSPIEENISLLNELKEKYNLYIISNFHRPAFDNIYKNWDFFNLFDGKIISAYHKLLKPEHEIYRLLLNNYSLNAEECVFIDDVKENVEAGKECGMKGIHLPSPNLLRNLLFKELEKEKISKGL